MAKRKIWLIVSGILFILGLQFVLADNSEQTDTNQPEVVNLVGTVQSQLECEGDWLPECEATYLTYDAANDLWVGEFTLPAGEYEYKVALNNSFDENYGLGAVVDGENIPLVLETRAAVTFYYNHHTHWVTDNVNSIIANVPGSFQSQLGCAEDWMPACLRSLLEDPDGDGVYEFRTQSIAAGSYEAKVVIGQTWDLNYGDGGTKDGANVAFDVPEDGLEIVFSFNTANNIITVDNGVEAEVVYAAVVPEVDQPQVVGIAGTFQTQLGCNADLLPDCEASYLTYDEEDGLWSGTFDLTAGEYVYGVALENSLGDAEQNSVLVLEADTSVTFIYNHATGWVTDSVNSIVANVAGDFQEEIGCPGDWRANCLMTWLQDPDGDGVYEFATVAIPKGSYEAKVALNQTWDESYGDGRANLAFDVPEAGHEVVFTYNTADNTVSIAISEEQVVEVVEVEQKEVVVGTVTESAAEQPVVVAAVEQPTVVGIPGTIQSKVGCSGDWLPDCEETYLLYNSTFDLWMGTFDLPAGEYEYKVALEGAWDENYGLNAEAGGGNIPLVLAEDTSVTFYYNHTTHWVTDSVNSMIANVPGNYQDEIGCPGEWAPDCLLTWLQDPDGDGVYEFRTSAIPAGSYEAKVAVNLTWTENYGEGGEQDGANIAFDVPEDGTEVVFSFNTADKLLTIGSGGAGATAGGGSAAIQVPVEPAEQPDAVTIPGTIQSLLGCSGDWMPDCEATNLTYNETFGLWMGEFTLPAGEYEYKVAINNTWDENYGLNAAPGGGNIPLVLAEETSVTFIYSHTTNWVMDNVNALLANVPGSYQDEVGCPGEWAPDCLRTWLQDPDGDGVYEYITDAIPAGSYEAKVALNMTWDVNYGEGGAQDGANIAFDVPEDKMPVAFVFNSTTNEMTINVGSGGVPVVVGNLSRLEAYWVTQDTIAWNVEADPNGDYRVYHAPEGGLALSGSSIQGGNYISLSVDENGLSADVLAKFPHLEGYAAFKVAEADLPIVQGILRSQHAIIGSTQTAFVGASSLQIAGALDDMFTYDGELGVIIDDSGIPTMKVWAPTAQRVRFHLFDDANPETEASVHNMTRDEFGVWSITGEADWLGKYYLYAVRVYVPSEAAVRTNLVTDPYSLSLSMNSQRSQIVDLNDTALMPDGWAILEKPVIESPENIVVYELHVRDFSVFDDTVPEDYKGKFMAFTLDDTNGMNHLQALSDAGLTHLHLLPTMDIATIDEDASTYFDYDFEAMLAMAPDSEEQQAIILANKNQDPFNWGYDPFHYTVPEGSYATDPDGPTRIVEFRQMVKALNERGLRLVIDVVYNHTNAAGQSEKSVLDRIVPGYYHRLNDKGNIETSTCCQNTATEHNMMRKLMVDSVVTWATAYKVDAFRFDLMGHHMLADMKAVRAALDALTLENDGVDGESIYVYGEGWNFGEVADNARGINATQMNIGGLGIGTFNDRLRDAVRGGSPFGGRQEQGFITGLYLNPTELTPGDADEQLARLLLFADQIRIGMAGNLRDYSFIGAGGEEVTGADIDYNGNPAGYTLDPQENIVYISKHDNETLYDIIAYKDMSDMTTADLARMQNLGLSIVGYSQGVPFFHAGSDMLRSKSMDRDSFDSGDWFNRLDFSYQSNNWGSGLPVEDKNGERWEINGPLLANENLNPGPEDIMGSVMHFREMLAIRASSPVFHLATAEDVMQRLHFHNTGPDQMPGVIVMSLRGTGLDDNYDYVFVVINATGEAIAFTEPSVSGLPAILHPIQQTSYDPIVREAAFDMTSGTFTVPARTTAVYVVPSQGGITTAVEQATTDLSSQTSVETPEIIMTINHPEGWASQTESDGMITVATSEDMLARGNSSNLPSISEGENFVVVFYLSAVDVELFIGDTTAVEAPTNFLSLFMETLADDPKIKLSNFSEITAQGEHGASISFNMDSGGDEAVAYWSVMQFETGFVLIAGAAHPDELDNLTQLVNQLAPTLTVESLLD